jgi:hypothetical protein
MKLIAYTTHPEIFSDENFTVLYNMTIVWKHLGGVGAKYPKADMQTLNYLK